MKAQAKAKAKTDTKHAVEIKVPAELKSIVSERVQMNAGIKALAGKSEQLLVKTAELVASLFKTHDDAKPVLAQAYKDAGLTSLVDGSQRSRILRQAFPIDRQLFKLAKAGPITFKNAKGEEVTKPASTLQLNAIAAGSLKPNKRGLWLPVTKSAGASGQGGHNAKTPLETLRAAIELAATNAIANGKLTWQAVLTQTVEVLKSVEAWEYDGDEAATLVSED